MYLWHKTARIHWVRSYEEFFQAHAHGQLVVISRPGHKRLQLEIICSSRSQSRVLLKEFGGRVEELPRNWLERFARAFRWKPLKIADRLIVTRSISDLRGCGVRRPQQSSHRTARPDALRTAHSTAQTIKPALLVIPASIAFGTGEHATTAMSLRLLEELTRGWKRGWSSVDLGTGSGILALAAKGFGAGRIVGIDIDPTAISTAKSNARLNKIRRAVFQFADVREWNPAQKTDVITANLYGDLLIEILPKLKSSRWLIFSGILRSQKTEFVRALQRNKIKIINIKRRGKWIAMVARHNGLPQMRELAGAKVLRSSQTAATVKTNAN